MSEVKVNKLSPRSGTTVTIGDSGDTINIVGTLQNNGSALTGDISSVVAGTGLSGGGTSGDVTLNVEAAQSGITSLGTLTALNVAGNTTLTTTDNSDNLTLVSTDADGTTGPVLNLYRNSGSPADGDNVGFIRATGKNDANQDVDYTNIYNSIIDASDGSEDGAYEIYNMVGGTVRSKMKMDATETVFNNDSVDLDFRVESDGNANMLFVDAGNDKVGIGTNSPASELEIESATPEIRIDATSGAGRNYKIHSDGNELYIEGIGSSGSLKIGEDGTYGVSIDLGTGGIQASDGIYLGGTGTANKLDDYEEGTFTPTFVNQSGGQATNYNNNSTGQYIKIGKMVYVNVSWQMGTISTGPGGLYAGIGGFPFVADGSAGGSPWYTNIDVPDGPATFQISNNFNYGIFYSQRDNNTYNTISPGAISSNDNFYITFCYKTD